MYPAAFVQKKLLESHSSAKHGLSERYVCKDCSITFINEEDVKSHCTLNHTVENEHKKSIHEYTVLSYDKKYKCDVCCKIFYTTDTLKEHKKSMHYYTVHVLSYRTSNQYHK